MENCDRAKAEGYATQELLKFIERDLGSLPVKVVAGALMRTSAALAMEVFGPTSGKQEARRALENILSQQTERKLQ